MTSATMIPDDTADRCARFERFYIELERQVGAEQADRYLRDFLRKCGGNDDPEK